MLKIYIYIWSDYAFYLPLVVAFLISCSQISQHVRGCCTVSPAEQAPARPLWGQINASPRAA